MLLLVILEFHSFFHYVVQVLDWMLGKGHAVLLRRAELKTFVDFHGNEVLILLTSSSWLEISEYRLHFAFPPL